MTLPNSSRPPDTKPRLLVLGDLMLDQYTRGPAERVSPEAAILVLRDQEHEARLGGAASVAALAHALGADVAVAGVLGADWQGRRLRRLLSEAGIQQAALFEDASRPTTVKHRFLAGRAGGQPQQLLRVDRESREPIPTELEERLMAALEAAARRYDAILISDYAKGVCTPALVASAIAAAGQRQVPVLVDPARGADYTVYSGATLIKPNRAELQEATGLAVDSIERAARAGLRLCDDCGFEAAVVTLDSDGVVLIEPAEGGKCHALCIPAIQADSARDVTGAGDMVLAALGVFLAEDRSLAEAVGLANIAAGLEVQRLGVAAVSRDEVFKAASPDRQAKKCMPAAPDASPERGPMNSASGPRDRSCKLVSLDHLASLVAMLRLGGMRIVFTNGVFDLLHVGHVACLEQASQLGDRLIVALNNDSSVRRLKGPDRPVIGQDQRAAMVAALECVDYVLVFDETTPHELLKRLKPDVLVKGGAYRLDQVEGHEIVEAYGGRVCLVHQVPSVSTTDIWARLAAAAQNTTNNGAHVQPFPSLP